MVKKDKQIFMCVLPHHTTVPLAVNMVCPNIKHQAGIAEELSG